MISRGGRVLPSIARGSAMVTTLAASPELSSFRPPFDHESAGVETAS